MSVQQHAIPFFVPTSEPLFAAVYHGCRATLYGEAFGTVYLETITRGNDFYLTDKLGEFGTDLSLLANFFERLWDKPVPTLTTGQAARAILQANLALRGVGRIQDAINQMRSLGVLGLSPPYLDRGDGAVYKLEPTVPDARTG